MDFLVGPALLSSFKKTSNIKNLRYYFGGFFIARILKSGIIFIDIGYKK